jgi:glycine cleavage system regulatory protein
MDPLHNLGAKMKVSLVLTVIGDDRPGIVERLSRTVAEHDGNWLESSMSSLAGKFAGILRAEVPASNAEALEAALEQLEPRGLHVIVEASTREPRRDLQDLRIELVGQDHPGIVRDISHLLAGKGINVEELETECMSAPMSGDLLFQATARLRVPQGTSIENLRQSLEGLAHDLMVDINLDDPRGGRVQS